MSIKYLKKILTKLKEIEDAGIESPENLLREIASLAGQLEPFLKDSPQKAEFDAKERHELHRPKRKMRQKNVKLFYLVM